MKKIAWPSRLVMVCLLALPCTKSYNQIVNTLSPAEKVYGLSKFWQEVNYNFVYLNKVNRHTWDSAYKSLITEVQATKNDYAYYRLLEKFCALLHDGHTEVYMPAIKGVSMMSNTFGDILVVTKRVDNKVIIKRTFKKDLDKFPLGSEIISVNGQPTDLFIRDSIAPYISTSTEAARLNIASMSLLRGMPGSTFAITIKKPNGEKASYTLTHARHTDSVLVPGPGIYTDEQNRDPFEFKMLDNQIAYVGLHTFSVEARIDTLFKRILPSLKNAKGVIIDLRYNGGGDDGIAFNILQHFVKDTVIVGSANTVRILDPYLQAIGRYVKLADTAGDSRKRDAWLLNHGYAAFNEPGIASHVVKKGIQKISVPVVVLIGQDTESAAEDFLIAAENQKHMVTMGEATNGSTGMPYTFDLPGGGTARVCVKKDTYADGREFVGYGIQPRIKVAPTVNDYIAGKDVVLEAALKYFAQNLSRLVGRR